MKHFDHIFIVTNDLTNDRRVKRIINELLDHNRSILLIGRKLSTSIPLSDTPYVQHRISCTWNRGVKFYAEFVIRTIVLILRNYRAKHITCNDIDTLLIGSLLKKIRKFTFYFDSHEWFEEVPELQGRLIKKKIWELITRIGLKYTDLRYTVNAEIADQLLRKYYFDFEVVRNIEPYSSLVDWEIKNPISPLQIVYLGVLNKDRGLEEMILSMSHIRNAELHIIGDGDLHPKLKRLVAQSPNKEKIILHGSLLPDEFEPILARSHVGINLLSGQSKSYYYSSANKVYDYLNHGLSVLTMDYPIYRKMSNNSEMIALIKTLNTTNLSTAIENIRAHYKLDELQKQHLRTIQKYNWEGEKLILSKLYNLN